MASRPQWCIVASSTERERGVGGYIRKETQLERAESDHEWEELERTPSICQWRGIISLISNGGLAGAG